MKQNEYDFAAPGKKRQFSLKSVIGAETETRTYIKKIVSGGKYLGASALLTLSLMVPLLSGCGGSGSEGKVVAVVSGDPIPLSELENQMKMAQRQVFSSFEEELLARKIIVDTLVVNQLLIREAYKRGFDDFEEVARIALSNKEKFLLDVLFNREIGREFTASEADVQDFFNKSEYKYRASHILVDKREEAEAILDSIADGVPFGRLAFNLSTDRQSASDDGDIGYFSWGYTADEFQNAIIRMSPGEVSSPVKTRFGWHIIRLVEKSPNRDRTTLPAMKYNIRQKIIDRNRNRRIQDYYDRMMEKHTVTVQQATVDFLLNKRERVYPPLILDQLPKNDFDMELLDQDEKSLALATWDGGQISLGEYLILIRAVPGTSRPDFDETQRLADLIFRLSFNDILSLEARQMGLESSDEFKAKMKRFRELTMAEIMKDSLPQPPPADEEQMLAYYDQNLEDYTTPEQIHVFELLVSGYTQAMYLRRDIRGLNKFKEAAAELTERPGKRASKGDLGFIESRSYPEIFEIARQVAVGEIAGPIEIGDKWSVIYVVDKRAEEIESFDATKRSISSRLARQQEEDAFSSWARKMVGLADVTIYEDIVEASIDKDRYPDSLAF